MKIYKLIILALLIPNLTLGQNLYNPQVMYDSPGGLFEEDSLRSIYLNFYDPNYHNYLVNSWFYDPDERIPAMLTLNGEIYDSVGVRYKGNSTFCLPNDNNSPKVPYNIDMNYFIGGQKLLGYKKIKLANAWMDPTFVKQIVASNIYRKYLPTGESNIVKLYSQGNYIGVYVNDESINKQFLEKHFNEKSGPLFKCDNIDRFCDTANAPSAMPPNLYYMGDDTTLYYNSYDMKSDHGWQDLVNLIKTIDLDFTNIDSVLNVDRTLWAFAVNQVIQNLDCYNTYYIHNYYLYQTKDGLFQMIPWDLDNSFVGAILGSFPWWSPVDPYEYDPYSIGEDHDNNGVLDIWEERPLVYKLLNDPHYRKIYTAHLRTIIEESLDTAMIRQNINNLQALAHNAVDQDNNKVFSINQYYDNVDNEVWTWWGFAGILSTINERKTFLLNHPEISLTPPNISNVLISNNIITAEISNTSNAKFMVTTSQYNSKFQAFSMFDDGTNGDVSANDGIYSLTIPNQFTGMEIKFYIKAENNEAIKLNPERAEYEFYIYSPITEIASINLDKTKKLIGITDMLGRKTIQKKGVPLFYLYNDGTVEKKIIIK